jgi:hypothetical protein
MKNIILNFQKEIFIKFLINLKKNNIKIILKTIYITFFSFL